MTICLGKELFIRFTVHVFREFLSVCKCLFPFWFYVCGVFLIIFVPEHCLRFILKYRGQSLDHKTQLTAFSGSSEILV